MRLQIKTTLIPVLTVSALIVGLYFLINNIIVQTFTRLESDQASKQIQRVRNAIETAVEQHALKIVDWSQWDDSYEFIQKPNDKYKDENLNPLTLAALNIDSVLYFTTELKLKYGVTIGGTGEAHPPSDSLISSMTSLINSDPSESKRGLFKFQNELLMVATAPILPTKADQPSRGTIVATAKIGQNTFDRLAYLTNLKVRFWRSGIDAMPSRLQEALGNNSRSPNQSIRIISLALARLYGTSLGLNENSSLAFEIDDPRVVVAAGTQVRNFTLIVLGITGAISLFFLLLTINSSAVKRIETLIIQVTEIARDRDSSVRLFDARKSSTSLRRQTAGGVLFVFALTTVIAGVLFNQYFLRGFEQIEDQAINDSLVQATRALEGRLDKIRSKTIDWAQWDDTYQFVVDQNLKYQEANLGFETLGPMNMKYVGYFDQKAEFKIGVEVDPESSSVQPLRPEIVESLKRLDTIMHLKEPLAGFVKLSSGPILIGASPILDTERSKPSRGVMVFGVPINEALVNDLAQQTKLNLNINQIDGNELLRHAPIERTSSREVSGTSLINSISGHPLLGITVKSDRLIYEQGVLAAKVVPFYFALGGILCAFVTVLCVDQMLLGRFRQISSQVGKIEDTKDLNVRLQTKGTDEISSLAQHINSMLAALDGARVELELAKNDAEQARHDAELARDEAERANLAKSSFIAKVSHELRTPIHSIVGMLRILLKEEPSKSKRAYIKMAKEAAYGLLGTINDILDFSKVESGNLSLESIEFHLREVIRDAMRTLGPRAEEKGTLEIIVDMAPDVPNDLIGDPLRIKQILINLIGNSIKFTKQGHIQLSVEIERYDARNVSLHLKVSDTGIGIPNDRLPTIFEPFTQADNTIARVYTGTGLGLTIVKQLVEEMGGQISVSSEVGVGTTFDLSIPFALVPSVAVPAPKYTWPFRKVILIDGGSPAFRVMHAGLHRFGLEAYSLDSSDSDAMRAVGDRSATEACIIVSSVAFKRSAVFNAIVNVASLREIPIVAILSPFEISLRERLSALHISHVVSRPISLEDVLLTASNQLETDRESWEPDDEVQLTSVRKLRVLIADDAFTNRLILTNMLEEAGHEVVCVENGLDMLNTLKPAAAGDNQDKPFDIVLTDIQMPLMDGLTATQKVRGLEDSAGQGGHIPIVAVTAHAMQDEKERMKGCGIDEVVTKPIEPSELARVLQKLAGITPTQPMGTAPKTKGHAIDSVDGLLDLTSRLWRQMESEGNTAELFGHYDPNDQHVSSENRAQRVITLDEILDVSDVFHRSGESIRRTKLIFNAFLQSFKDQLARLSSAKNDKKPHDLQSASHALKGLLLDIGAKGPGHLAGSMEALCKQDQGETAMQLVTALINQTLTVASLVEKIIAHLEPQPAQPQTDSDLVKVANRAMKETVIELTDHDLTDLFPKTNNSVEEEHPSVALVYQLLDVHGVLTRAGNNTTRSLLIFGAFLQGYEDLLRDLDKSCEAGDLTRMQEVSRSLRNVLKDTGCPLGADVALEIERLCAIGDLEQASRLCGSLKHQTRVVGKVLTRICHDLNATVHT